MFVGIGEKITQVNSLVHKKFKKVDIKLENNCETMDNKFAEASEEVKELNTTVHEKFNQVDDKFNQVSQEFNQVSE